MSSKLLQSKVGTEDCRKLGPHYHHPRGSWLEDRIPIATKGGKTAAGKDQIIHYTQQEEGKSFFYNSHIQFGGDSEAGNLRT